MHDALHVADRLAISEPGQDRACFKIVFVGILVVEGDSNWVMPKKQRRNCVEQFAILGFQAAAFFQNLFACLGHFNDDKAYPSKSLLEMTMFHQSLFRLHNP